MYRMEGALKLAGPDWAKEEVETRKVRIQLEKGTLNNAKRLKRTIKMFSALKVKLLGKKMPREADDCSRINKYLLDLIAEMKAAMKVRNNPKQNAARAKKIKMQLTRESPEEKVRKHRWATQKECSRNPFKGDVTFGIGNMQETPSRGCTSTRLRRHDRW